MSTARALLREAASSRVGGAGGADGPSGFSDPFAVPASKGKPLRCRACNYQPIKHDSLWAPHVASKSHRANVAKIRAAEEEEAARKKARIEEEEAKRTSSEAAAGAAGDDAPPSSEGKRKRGAEDGDLEEQPKRSKANGAEGEDDDMEEEWARFQQEVLNAPPSASANTAVHPSYQSATIFAEPVLVNEDGQMEVQSELPDGVAAPPPETAEEKRRRLEREEKEEIYARFEEEQRVQDEAEERVAALKARLARIKEERLAKAKSGGGAGKGKASSKAR